MLQVKQGMDDNPILQYVHGLYHDLGVQDLTLQTDYAWPVFSVYRNFVKEYYVIILGNFVFRFQMIDMLKVEAYYTNFEPLLFELY